MNTFPLVSVITVNYNQMALTCQLIASLRAVSYPAVEVIVVDNGSAIDETDMLAAYPEVRLVRSAENLGFAGGNNLGIRSATGKYLFFLNNDTEVDPAVFEPLVELFERNPKAGIASPKIIYYDSGNTIQYAGSAGMNPWTGRSITIGAKEPDNRQHDDVRLTPIIDGAAMMVPAEVVRVVGEMPEMYFLYYEELDWCEMIKRCGYESYYVGTGTVYHKESMSVGKFSLTKTYYMNRNRLLFIRRNFKGMKRLTSTLVFLLAAIPKHTVKYALGGQWKHVGKLWEGIFWNLKQVN